MISYAEALAVARAAGARRPAPEESIPLDRAVGRFAARALLAGEAVPAFDNSGMDGFAVRARDLAGASPDRPLTLPVSGSLAAGDDAGRSAGAEGAVEIMTGAPVPPGFDAVVRVEDVEVRRGPGGAAVAATFRAPVSPGDDVRPAGEDFRPGAEVAAAGDRLGPAHVLALATLGHAEVWVQRRPLVALVSTGKEVLPVSTRELPPGAIRNSTSSYLAAALPLLGAQVISRAATGDDPGALRDALERARIVGADLVLTTGAVSAGRHDFVPEVLAGLGARTLFHKVAVRPGKPVLLAEIPRGPAVLGLPGNPVASAVSLRFLAAPLLRAALGLPEEAPLRAPLAADVKKPEGLRCFLKARLSAASAGARVEVTSGQGSAIVSSLVGANAWAVLPEEGSRAAAGALVEVYPQYGPFPYGAGGEA